MTKRPGALLMPVRLAGAAGDFSASQFSVQTLIWCSYSPASNGTHQHLWAHTGSCTTDCTHTKMLLTLAEMGSAAPAAAIA